MRSRVPRASKKSQKYPIFPPLAIPLKDKAIQLWNICRVPRSTSCRLASFWFSFCKPVWAEVSCFCEFSGDNLDSFGFYNLFPSSAGFSELLLMFDCETLSVFIIWWMKTLWWQFNQGTSLVRGDIQYRICIHYC